MVSEVRAHGKGEHLCAWIETGFQIVYNVLSLVNVEESDWIEVTCGVPQIQYWN